MDRGHQGGRARHFALIGVPWGATMALLAAVLVACALAGLAACGRAEAGASATTLAELEDRRIGVTTGTIQATQATKRFPNAKIMQYASTTDMLTALRSHKIDAFAESDAVVRVMRQTEPDLEVIEEPLSERMAAAGIFPKTDEGRALCDE